MRQFIRLVDLKVKALRYNDSPYNLALRCLSGVKKIREPEADNSSGSKLLESAARFHDVADHTLEQVMQLLTPLESEQDDVDIACSQGVLNINLGSRGMWVINKQTPNRQLWWSSPLSGPRRYEYCPSVSASAATFPSVSPSRPHRLDDAYAEVRNWKGTADGGDLLSLLHAEVEATTGVDILRQATLED